jgi:carbon monoxide dehydrogenase subunit G
MKLHNEFFVDLPQAAAWTALLDIPLVASCMPGAELLETIDSNTYRGLVKAKLGPIAVTFQGTTRLTSIDATRCRVEMAASGKEARGRGGAEANIEFCLVPAPGGTRAVIETNVNLVGAVAQYGRAQGVIADVAQQIVNQFAENLRARVGGLRSDDAMPPPRQTHLSVWSILRGLVAQWFKRVRAVQG